MTTADIRRKRLALLIQEKYDNSQASFVSATGENQGEVSALLKNKSFGEKKARSIEEKCLLPVGWLDISDGQPTQPITLMNRLDGRELKLMALYRSVSTEGQDKILRALENLLIDEKSIGL